jgi:nucleotide-binding universal stress UspA family protein
VGAEDGAMLQTIVVATDGSSLAERALPCAEALARGGARILLVRAVPRGAPREEAAEAKGYLAGIAERLRAAGITADLAVPDGDPAAAILEAQRDVGADLIVMATHGRSGLGRWVYGSTAEAVLGAGSAPVLLVRAGTDTDAAPSLADQPRLLVPLDGSPFSEQALPVAADVARAVQGRLVLLQAVAASPSPLDPEDVVRALEHNAREAGEEYLGQVARRLAGDDGVAAPETIVRMAEPAESIIGEAAASGAALVVMATHGRTGLGRLISGSVARAVLERGSLPLLLIRPAGLRAAPPAPGEAGARP